MRARNEVGRGDILSSQMMSKICQTRCSNVTAESKLGALFINAKEAVRIRRILSEMGHPQPRTLIQTDNSTAEGVINSRVRPKRTKSMDMRFEWLLDRQQQSNLKFIGDQVKQTWRTILQSIILPRIIEMYRENS